ncbi:polysaccharide biosynthesis tyrosine autokinase [Haliscomenobacter sp.]|uniref:GumC family protein n=1 Tax=Haliscomenobacter sp. TaxID=2717303 RepID=UPI0033650112
MNEFEYQKAVILNNSGNDSTEGQIDYLGMFRNYVLNKWYLYLVCGIISLGLAYMFYKQLQPVYQITSKLLIREREENSGSDDDFIKRNLLLSATSDKASNDIEILTSFSLMTSVVEKLGLGTRYYWKDKLSERDAYRNFPIVVDTFSLNLIENTSFEITPLSKHTFRFSQGAISKNYNFGQLFSNKFGKFRISRVESAPVAADKTMHVEFLNPKKVAKKYLDNLNIELSSEKSNSSVRVLSLMDEVPQRGIDVLTCLMEKFDQVKSQANTDITLKTLELLDGRLQDISQELASAESTLETYKLDNEIISSTTSDIETTLGDVKDLAREQRNLELQSGMLQSISSELRDTSNNFKIIPINPSLYDGKVLGLIQPYNDLVLQRERLLMSGQPSNPVVQSTNQKLRSLRNSIVSAIANMQGDISSNLSKLQNQFDKSNNRLRSVPIKERGLTDKVRTQGIKENLYVYLLQKREEVSMALVSDYANSMIVDPPYSSLDPVGMNKVQIFAGAGLGGMAIPLFFILLLDFFKGSIRTEQDIRQIIPEKPILGVINLQKGKNQLLVGPSQNMTIERFRTLRTNLQFHHREKIKCILVTSSTSGEGKTFVATNLALSFARAKKNTIIIDFDLRKPSVNRYFNGSEEIGLSSFFIEGLALDEIIQISADVANLHYISGGPIIPNLVELITEEQLIELFSYLKGRYDIIIIDSSPIGIIADGIMLNNYVDNSLFVVRSGYSKKATVEKAKEIFAQNKLVNPSIIFNGVKKQDDGYGYGYRQYGYS